MQGLDEGTTDCRVPFLDVFGGLIAESSIEGLILLTFSRALGDDAEASSFLRE